MSDMEFPAPKSFLDAACGIDYGKIIRDRLAAILTPLIAVDDAQDDRKILFGDPSARNDVRGVIDMSHVRSYPTRSGPPEVS